MLIESMRKYKYYSKPASASRVASIDAGVCVGSQDDDPVKLSVPVLMNLVSIQEEDDPNFGLIAVDEMSPKQLGRNVSDAIDEEDIDDDEESSQDSDSTKSVIGSNRSLLLRPSKPSSENESELLKP